MTARDPAFPAALRHDPQPPAVLFVRGDLAALDARRVGIVGTRNATQAGRDIAVELGARSPRPASPSCPGWPRASTAPPTAACSASPAVGRSPSSATAPTSPYPRVHAALWAEVCARGLLLSEWPPGTPPEPFRFPMRNRILAALSEVLVVVESRERGGSLITAQAAIERSVDVMAVPGSVRNRAAAGTNQLLRDGAAPVTERRRRAGRPRPRHPPRRAAAYDPRPLPRGTEADVLAACRDDPRTLDEIVVGLDLPIAEAAMALARLERTGWVREAGGWFEPVVSSVRERDSMTDEYPRLGAPLAPCRLGRLRCGAASTAARRTSRRPGRSTPSPAR